MEVFITFVLPVLVGIGIGVLSGMLGIGGGTVMVPIFRLVFDMSAIMSTATSLFTIIPTSVSGAISHIRNKTCIIPLGLAAGIGGACTSPFGVLLATKSASWMIMTAAALIVGYSAISMLRKAYKMKPEQGSSHAHVSSAEVMPLASKEPATAAANTVCKVPSDSASSVKISRKQLAIGVGIGLVAGLASGYVGVGGGFIMVPLMLSLIGIPMKKASGTSLIAVMILAIPGVIEQGLLGNINYTVGIAVAAGSIPGAVVGAQLVRKVPERILRFIFGGFLVLAAVLLVLNETGIIS